MKASLLYRITSLLMLLFAAGHTFGFRQIDPTWGCPGVVAHLSWRYFFLVPVIFSVSILLCLTAAAWISGNPRSSGRRIPYCALAVPDDTLRDGELFVCTSRSCAPPSVATKENIGPG